MIIIRNKMIPFNGYKGLTLWPFLFVRSEMSTIDMNHELIHGRQQREMLVVPFFVWYALEYLVRLCIYRSHKTAYKNISLEQEAYERQYDDDYLSRRRLWAWTKYL
jgi:hypothetical protein